MEHLDPTVTCDRSDHHHFSLEEARECAAQEAIEAEGIDCE